MTPEGIAHIDAIKQAAKEAIKGTPLEGSKIYLGGTAATFKDMQEGSNYDLLMPGVAALLLVRALPGEARPLALILPLAVWMAALYNPPRVMPLGLTTPLLLLGLIWAFYRGSGTPKPLPSKG